MDHHHHPPSSSTTTKEEQDLSHDDQRANTNASSSATINDHDVDTSPLPQPATLHLYSLPDIAHDAIASYLTMKDMHCMMESSQWLLKAYGGRVKELRLYKEEEDDDDDSDYDDRDEEVNMALALSIMRRRPGLVRVSVGMDKLMGVVAEAMRKGYCDKLQLLRVVDSGRIESSSEPLQALCDALADGLCPKINALVVPDTNDLVPSMGKALQSRMGKGCCGLKSLEINGDTWMLSPLLSSGACEALEELKMDRVGDRAEKDLSEWLLRTKAPHLRAFICSTMDTTDVAKALCSPDIAPRLQVLELYTVDATSLPLLSEAIGGGAWPQLREFRAEASESTATRHMMPSLVEAIGVGARELTSLKLNGHDVGPEGGMAVARMLRDGGCPRLEELDLSMSFVEDDAVVEVVRALEGGAPCNTTLRQLNLFACDITSVGMRELMESMGRGALPHLECLYLDENDGIEDDSVIVLAQAMAGGLLPSLQKVDLFQVGMKEDGAKALFEALRDHKPCPHLNKLNVGSNKIGDDCVIHLAKAIEAGALQHLQQLTLWDVGMGEEGFKSLVKAIVAQQPNPGSPRLEVLELSGNKDIGDGGVMYLAEMMKVKGAMQNLRVLGLGAVGMSIGAAKALFKVLDQDHACPNLEELGLKEDSEEDEVEIDAEHGRQIARELMHVREQQRHCTRIKID